MNGNFENLQLPASFSGIVRLFPLPNLVLFPGVIQPLHIFERRYRQLMEDALAADELIAIALMKPGWEPNYEGQPAINQTVCIGRIMTHTRLEDGRFNLLLQGVSRGRIEREIATDRLYRMAEVTIPKDVCAPSHAKLTALGEKIKRQFQTLCANDPNLDEEAIECLLGGTLSLSKLADLTAFALNIDPAIKQLVLSTNDLARRLEIVSQELDLQLKQESTSGVEATFPPCFSSN